MKILWVKSGKILPVDTGGKIRSYNILRRLSSGNEVAFISYYGGRRDEAYEQEIARDLPGTQAIHTATPDATAIEQAFDYVRRFPSGKPFAVSKFASTKVKRIVDCWIRNHQPDIAVCDFLSASLNFPRHPATPTVLFQHNVESVLWQRQADTELNPFKRAIFKIEARRMVRYEAEALQAFHHIIAVSEQDRARMAAMTDAARISVVPTGVDLSCFKPDPAVKVTKPLVLFIGSMDWQPNIDGVDYFCREIWPRVLAKVPQARFRIVGRNPTAAVRRLVSDTVEVTGTVPSVMTHLRESAVVVVPLRAGGGTRLKIPEAMAVGKSVVSTSVGAEGLDLHP
ncbi:MAG: glycosyltransferase, partial [Terriglobia bacterium]